MTFLSYRGTRKSKVALTDRFGQTALKKTGLLKINKKGTGDKGHELPTRHKLLPEELQNSDFTIFKTGES